METSQVVQLTTVNPKNGQGEKVGDSWSRNASKYVPKSDIEILNQEIDDEEGLYRIRTAQKVRYLTIAADVFDEDTMCRPYLLVPSLPELPDTQWTTMHIYRSPDGTIQSTISDTALPGIQTVWHPEKLDVLSLKRIQRHRENVHEAIFNGGRTAISKIARWTWEIPRIENETRVYEIFDRYRVQHPEEPPIAPKFLGHLTENGRVVGFLLEKVDGQFACLDDFAQCEELVCRIHGLGLIHGDVNRYNFLVDNCKGQVRMVDFEHVEDFDEEAARVEREVLPSELGEETGRGGPAIERQDTP